MTCDGAVEEDWLCVVDCDGVNLGLETSVSTYALEFEKSHSVAVDLFDSPALESFKPRSIFDEFCA